MRYLFPQKAMVNSDQCDLNRIDDQTVIHPGSIVWILFESDKPYVHPVWRGTPKKTATVLFNGMDYEIYRHALSILPMKGHTVEECVDENWKTQLARGYKNIPQLEKIEILATNFVNLYGSFCKVKWNDNVYYVKPECIAVDEGPYK